MGIRYNINLKDIPQKYQQYGLKPTSDGQTDTVYLLCDKYILKLFHTNNKQQIENERSLLNQLSNLKVPQLIDIFKIDNRYCAIYSQIGGKSIKNPTFDHIKQTALFLKQLHKKTINNNSSNKQLFSKQNLKNMIIKTQQDIFLELYNSIEIDLKNDGIIHGDLFCDNAKFKDDKLSGVYDFTQACNGDFLFDLGVVAISWCVTDNQIDHTKVDSLIKHYDNSINKDIFINYIRYCLLYYCVNRYINHQDYMELYNRYISLKY